MAKGEPSTEQLSRMAAQQACRHGAHPARCGICMEVAAAEAAARDEAIDGCIQILEQYRSDEAARAPTSPDQIVQAVSFGIDQLAIEVIARLEMYKNERRRQREGGE